MKMGRGQVKVEQQDRTQEGHRDLRGDREQAKVEKVGKTETGKGGEEGGPSKQHCKALI